MRSATVGGLPEAGTPRQNSLNLCLATDGQRKLTPSKLPTAYRPGPGSSFVAPLSWTTAEPDHRLGEAVAGDPSLAGIAQSALAVSCGFSDRCSAPLGGQYAI